MLLTAAALGAVALCSTTANADTFTLGGNQTAVRGSLTIASLTNGQIVFSFANATPNSLSSRLTGIGFDLPTNGPFSLTNSPVGTNFTFSTNPGNVPQFNGANLDFAEITGNNIAGGNPPSGLANGVSSGNFTVTGNFAGLSQQTIAQNTYIRFQAIDSNPSSDVANGIITISGSPVPEPSEWLAMGMAATSVGGLMIRARRRKGTRETLAA
ncbi:MAG: PEP-CTERM sorting domain-containing protein [Armatimonadota bacterium]